MELRVRYIRGGQRNSTPVPSQHVSMARLRELLEDETLTPIVDRSSPLPAVREALLYSAEGEPIGRIVITPT